jgi:hypothetical protein
MNPHTHSRCVRQIGRSERGDPVRPPLLPPHRSQPTALAAATGTLRAGRSCTALQDSMSPDLLEGDENSQGSQSGAGADPDLGGHGPTRSAVAAPSARSGDTLVVQSAPAPAPALARAVLPPAVQRLATARQVRIGGGDSGCGGAGRATPVLAAVSVSLAVSPEDVTGAGSVGSVDPTGHRGDGNGPDVASRGSRGWGPGTGSPCRQSRSSAGGRPGRAPGGHVGSVGSVGSKGPARAGHQGEVWDLATSPPLVAVPAAPRRAGGRGKTGTRAPAAPVGAGCSGWLSSAALAQPAPSKRGMLLRARGVGCHGVWGLGGSRG